jgi:hypothetical protein
MASQISGEVEPISLQVGETVEFRDFSSDQPRRAVITGLGRWYASIRLEGEQEPRQVPEKTLRKLS